MGPLTEQNPASGGRVDKDGREEVRGEIPRNGENGEQQPVRSPYYLRDRATLHRYIRYQANMADCLKVDRTSYAKAAASPYGIKSMSD
jgi:hypothetical protein